ncbi:MAG: Fic family protein [Candidatus Omnitrophica bacterium]|nr:Fic family protein [Candidatus Omnitrophota bacterium]
MKIPHFPNIDEFLKDDKGVKTFQSFLQIHKDVQKETGLRLFLKKSHESYCPWDKFSNLSLPKTDYSHEILWVYMKMFMRSSAKQVKHVVDIEGKPFAFSLTDAILKNLHFIDMHLSDNLVFKHTSVDEDQKEEWLKKRVISSLIDEAITSSQIEGAATTRKQAKAMIKSGKKPKTHDEKMILNNYRAIRLITEDLKNEALSVDLIKKIHSVLANGLLEDPDEIGEFRHDDKEEDKVKVWDDDTILFIPPNYKEIEQRITDLCAFANDDQEFYHPVIKAIILHFMIGYIHPFVDGNGRTARGLFYWYLVRNGYRLFEYVSISEVIKKSIGQYKRAYLYTEKDGGDLTYFIYYHLGVILKCVETLEQYIQKKIIEHDTLKKRIRQQEGISLRQIDLLNHAIRHKDAVYTIKGHLNSNKISWATARSDLLNLVKKDFLTQHKSGKELYFLVSDQIEDLLMESSD